MTDLFICCRALAADGLPVVFSVVSLVQGVIV